MNFIDISSWQAGINLDAVFAQNPIHGVIVKSTEKTNYVNPYCDKWVQWCIAHDKPWGFYHFLNGTDPVEEAKYFVKHTINYFHDGIPVADYEADIVARGGTPYLKTFLDTVYEETNVKPMVYCNLSTIQGSVNAFRSIATAGYPLWLAQWASAKDQIGFNEHPWQSGSYQPFHKITMQQYTDHGKLNGYDGYLDFDVFFGDRAEWDALAGKNVTPEPSPAPSPSPSDDKTEKIISLLEQIIALLR